MWELSHCHLQGWMRGKEWSRWVLVLFKLLRHQLEGIYCLRQLSLLWGQADCAVAASLGVLIYLTLCSSFPTPLLPHPLQTLHGTAKGWQSHQLPPWVSVHTRASLKIEQLVVKFEGQFWLNYSKMYYEVLKTGQKTNTRWMLGLLILPILCLLFCHLRAVHAFRSRKSYLDTDLCEERFPGMHEGVSRWNLFLHSKGTYWISV